ARLEAALADEDAERARLRQLERDADPTIGAATRVRALALFFVVATGISIYAVHLQKQGPIGPAALIALPAVMAVVIVAFMFAFWRKLMVNAFSRRLAVWFLVLILVLVASRIFGQAMRLAMPQQYVVDGLLYTSYVATGGIFLYRWAWLCAAVLLAGAVVGLLAPSAALVSFAVATSIVIVISALFLLRPTR
ncbi:MAG TPA: hypothetical protein VFU21_14330, partial [Kofleriaceae bacterium]|nr:hypothetical protein [Kofleriaceae bacterium]